MKKLSLTLSALLLMSCSSTKNAETTKTEPATFVLVHGALATKEAWSKTEKALAAKGHKSVSVNVPGRGGDGLKPKDVNLEVATKKVCEVVNAQAGEVILVGHSQGGALITHALSFCPQKVRALVYVTAVVPFFGETPFQMLDPKVDTGFGKITSFDQKAALFRLNRKAPVAQLFMGDVPKKEAAEAVKMMVSEPIGIGTMVMNTANDLIFAKRTYYVETTEDKIISPQTQKKMYSRLPNAKVYTMKASHAPFLSQPERLAEILAETNVN